jgi:large subunit ribosomal protein L13
MTKHMPAKKIKDTEKYYLFDCQEKNLGRIATQAAFILQGKHKAAYLPNVISDDFVVVINSKEAKFSGNKEDKKLYHHYSGYPGGISTKKLGDLLEIRPEKVIRDAIYGMLPKNNLRDKMLKKLFIFEDANHDLEVDLIKKS